MTTLRVPALTMDTLQRTAAESPEGPLAILGGPGTGKTHTIIARVALLLKGGASPHTITCLTFSSRGAEDLRRQMEQLPLTAEDAPHIFIGTIHHYASFYLRRAGATALGISPHFTIWDQQQAIEVITELMDRDATEGDKVPTAEISEILDWNGRNQTRSPEEAEPPRKAYWLEIVEEYRQEKRRQSTLDLDDLIPLAAQAMELDPETRTVWNRTRTRHLLIDEFQDVTPRQHHMVNLMTGPTRSVTVAADPNQSTYRWMGADPRLLEQFRLDHVSNLNMRMLQVNHRGTRTMSNIATILTRSDQLRGLNDDYQSAIRVEGSRPTLTEFDGRPEQMDKHILDSARRMAEDGRPWEDMACIYRTHRTLNRMVTQFSSMNIPHTVLGETQRDRDSNARCITALMSLTLNPMDLKAFTIAASLEVRNKKRRMNRELAGKISNLARENRTDLVQASEEYIERLNPGTPIHRSLQYIINGWGELNRMLDEPDTELYDICRRANGLLQQAQHAGTAPVEEPQTFRLLGLSQTTLKMGRESPLEFMAAALQPEHQSPENEESPIRPGPVASTSEAIMTLEEIQDRTGDYMALKLWTGMAHRTAENAPRNFHQTLFSEPDPHCVEQYWKLLEETPDLTAETLTVCGENSAARGRDQNWNNASQAEREDRARRSAGLLFWSIYPPSLMSVTIAHRRGRDVSVRTNPVFARFAAEYNGCEEATGEYALQLAGAETSE